jgi:lipoprotein-anchoring transpeptidase ErfK/SrfK
MFACVIAAALFASAASPGQDGDVFARYLEAPLPPADTFDVPHTAPRLDSAVGAVAGGRVVSRDASAVVLEHLAYVNHERRVIRSTYSGLTRVAVGCGEVVGRGHTLGYATAEAAVEVSGELPSGELMVPLNEPQLVIISHDSRRLRLYEYGEQRLDAEVAFGQASGRKERRGDLKTPHGMYHVTSKSRGPFTGPSAAYFGGFFMKLNYPNRFDAAAGRASGLVTEAQAAEIDAQWRGRALTTQRTLLGGGIGLHGWAYPWTSERDGHQLSWGCIVLHADDMVWLFERLDVGATVVLF